jgi:diacylglycerol kinase (ATP)
LLNPLQIIDLKKEPLDKLKVFTAIPNLKLVVCGGDGTVASILNFVLSGEIANWKKKNPPVAILPLGTGNDLGRSLGWGGGEMFENAEEFLLKMKETQNSV